MKKILFEVVICILLPVLVAVVGAEIYVRATGVYVVCQNGDFLVTYTEKGKRLVPNSKAIYSNGRRKITLSVNSHGFRDDEMPLAKQPGEIRILVLGDSITLASPEELEDTYVGRMEELLRKKYPGRNINVINGGLDGLGLKDEVEILIENGLSLSPDLVLVQFYLNDSQPADEFGAVLTNPGWLRRHSLLAETLYRRFMEREWVSGKVEKYPQFVWTSVPVPQDLLSNRQSFREYAATARLDWGAAWYEENWRIVDRELERLARLSKENGFKVVIMCSPVIFQLYTDYQENYPQVQMAKLAAKYGFYYYDLLTPLRRVGGQEKLFFDHCHLTGGGHVLVGRLIGDYIAENFCADFE